MKKRNIIIIIIVVILILVFNNIDTIKALTGESYVGAVFHHDGIPVYLDKEESYLLAFEILHAQEIDEYDVKKFIEISKENIGTVSLFDEKPNGGYIQQTYEICIKEDKSGIKYYLLNRNYNSKQWRVFIIHPYYAPNLRGLIEEYAE